MGPLETFPTEDLAAARVASSDGQTLTISLQFGYRIPAAGIITLELQPKDWQIGNSGIPDPSHRAIGFVIDFAGTSAYVRSAFGYLTSFTDAWRLDSLASPVVLNEAKKTMTLAFDAGFPGATDPRTSTDERSKPVSIGLPADTFEVGSVRIMNADPAEIPGADPDYSLDPSTGPSFADLLSLSWDDCGGAGDEIVGVLKLQPQPRNSTTTGRAPVTSSTNTCEKGPRGGCTLDATAVEVVSVRKAPETSAPVLFKTVAGDVYQIECQTEGELVTDGDTGTSTRTWLQIAYLGWVSALYMTPVVGIPSC